MKHTAVLRMSLLVMACCRRVQSNEGETVFLERGHRGIVPCPPITSQELMVADTDVMYWYFGQPVRESTLISYFKGTVAPQNGIPDGVYDINKEFSLVIENVTDFDKGNYYYKIVKPRQSMPTEGMVPVDVWCYECIIANTERETMFLERGHRGIVPCPLITSQELMVEDIDAMYWYFRHKRSRSLLISFFKGTVATQKGIPEGVYDIDQEFSLVIENVTDSDEGNYFFAIKPRLRLAEYGHVPVVVKVSPREPFPIVVQRKVERPSEPERETQMRRRSKDDGTLTLTCIVYNAKPAVVIRWLRVLSDGSVEDLYATSEVAPTVLPGNTTETDVFWINNTFTTSATIEATPVRNDDMRYRCEVYGDALGDRNGRHVTVILIETQVPGEVGAIPSTTERAFDPCFDGEDIAAANEAPDHEPNASSHLVVFGLLVFGVNILI